MHLSSMFHSPTAMLCTASRGKRKDGPTLQEHWQPALITWVCPAVLVSLVLRASKFPPTMSTPGLLWRIFLPHADVAASQDLGLGLVTIRRPTTRSLSHDLTVLVDELEVVAAEEMGYGGELRPVAGRVVVELEEGDGQ